MVTGKLLPVHKWNLNKEASSLPQLLNAFLHTCPLPDRACWTTTYIPLAFNCHSNLKYPSLLLHAVNWKSPLIVSCRVALLETPETPPLPCTWLRPLLTSTCTGPMHYQTLDTQQWCQCLALSDTEWTSRRENRRSGVCVYSKAVGNETLRGRAGWRVGAEGLSWNLRGSNSGEFT